MTLLAHDNNKSCSGKLKAVNLSQDNKDKTHWPVAWVGVFTSLIIKLRVNANEFSTDTVSCSFLQSHTFKVSNCKDKGMFCWEKAEKVYFCTIFAIFQLNTFVPECSYLWMLKCSLWMQWDVSSVWPPSDDRLTESHSLFSLSGAAISGPGNICTAAPITSTLNIFIFPIIIHAVYRYVENTNKSDNNCQTFWYFIFWMWQFVFLEHKTRFCTNKPFRFSSVCPKSYNRTWILF